ncbi:lytic murein transglycosylase [Methylobacillus gramineus]|uniref:lytic murein transglycosylase n=1 Tax=Methylobacillus gramineus TaxID=755169 RepID=UPI001CFFBFD0|nr:lytic murein transglycosylase [Methylobacillus gramineus]MCB5184051.1 lytic murein transglycosylase [Methylobacillus gramineus]
MVRRSMAWLFVASLVVSPFSQAAEQSFTEWVQDFSRDALTKGISEASLQAALAGAQLIERVVELDQSQPEFVQTFAAYINRRITTRQVNRGQQLLQEHRELLLAVEKQYGVPPEVLVSFWGLETNYGQTLGSFETPIALATLAYEGRRREFFRSQLLDALRILDGGHVAARDMLGSWAGAVGHMQFMPSTFRAYAVDGDGDGRINVWQSIPDAMYSAGHYLQSIGWKPGEPVMVEVQLPPGFAWEDAQAGHQLTVTEWMERGVRTMNAETMPPGSNHASIVLPQGWRGPAFMVFDNFYVVMKWNRSTNYALAVGGLANRLVGGKPIAGGQEAEQSPVSIAQIKQLQEQLTGLGFDAGTADGLPGPKTQTAIRDYQLAHGLPADGFASPSLLSHVVLTKAPQVEDTELIPGFPGTQP